MAAHSAQLATSPAVSDDLELVHASKNGDVAAFEQLVKRHDRRLHRIAQHVLHNTEDSEDAVQEAFLKAFQHLSDFRGRLAILDLADSHHGQPVPYEVAKAALNKRSVPG